MKKYDPKSIEPKWQKAWADTKLYAAKDGDPTRPKYYMLAEFPYPSGAGLHAGHAREYTLGDVISRHKRMQGYNVLYPMGYDAFGLPTENYAIKHKIKPQVATAQNIATFRRQFEALGYSFDWDRAVTTSDPAYYKWTQWLFLQFLKAGLAYQDEIPINWCPKEKTGLANEEVVNGVHERCGTPVEKKLLKQWMLKITAYADRLIDGLKTVDYPPRIADQQVNWIGRSEGAEIDFEVAGEKITVYTTRPDTLAGATFLVLAPEHALVQKITKPANKPAVDDYIAGAAAETDLQRQTEERPKTGVATGAIATNPITGRDMPVWIADYVLASYGTGAIMAVPAHDERDFAFAKAFDLPIIPVIAAPKTKTALILHGTDGDNQKAWIPWLKHNLEAFGYKVIAPNLPKSEFPVLSDWLEALKPYAAEINDQSIIVGHSLGGPTAEHFITGNNLRIKQLLLVAPTFPDMDWEPYLDRSKIHNGQNIHDVSVVPVDWQKLQDSVAKITVFASKNDPHVNYDRLAKHASDNLPQADFVSFDGMSHFNDAAHVLELPQAIGVLVSAYAGTGKLINSGKFDGMSSIVAKPAITKWLYDKGIGRGSTKYRLRDWIFSRQHYWGEPIPVIHCTVHGVVPVPEDQLPVTLPDVEHYEPTDTGESPLAAITDWVNTVCPICGKPAKRETDTMPNWAGSSWYYLRFMDPHNDKAFAGKDKLKYWGMVDLYLGGMEHTTLHLLYSRFWHQFLFDQGLVPTPEPYAARVGQGIVLAADGRKMSKSIGNVIDPTDIIAKYGADAFRLYIMFMAPYDETTPWSDERLNGVSRFLYRAWTLCQELLEGSYITPESVGYENSLGAFEVEIDRATHQTIKKVHDDLQGMRYNTVVSALMEYVNTLTAPRNRARLLQENALSLRSRTLRSLILLLAPAAPHITEELWYQLGETQSVHIAPWPKYDPQLIKDDFVTIVVQVNGKMRAQLAMPADASDSDLTKAARADPNTIKHLAGKDISRTIVVPRKLVNFVVK